MSKEVIQDSDLDTQKLPQFKVDMLRLIDLVTEHSERTELVSKDALLQEFVDSASAEESPAMETIEQEMSITEEEVIQRIKNHRQSVKVIRSQDGKIDLLESEHPNLRSSRKILSRREMLTSLVHGDIVPSDLKVEEEAEIIREVTPEYFEQVLAKVLEEDLGVCQLISYDGVIYLHYQPLLSCSYARLLSAKNNPKELICQQVRENSEVYPRPVPVYVFQNAPYSLEPSVIQEALHSIGNDEALQDIRYTQSSIGTIFLYSNKFLSEDYAEFLAEQQDVVIRQNP